MFPLILQRFVLVEAEQMKHLLQGLACSEQKILCFVIERKASRGSSRKSRAVGRAVKSPSGVSLAALKLDRE